jgi:TonB family protein
MKDHKALYGIYIRSSMLVSLIIAIFGFTFVPTIEMVPFEKTSEPDSIIIVDPFIPIEPIKPDLPPVRPVKPPVVAVIGDYSDTVQTMGQTVFDDLNPRPIIQIEPVKYHKLEIKPKPIKKPSLEYPEILRQAGIEGSCVVWGIIDTTGKVIKARIYHSANNKLFDEAALTTFIHYEFSPGYQHDRPVPVEIVMPFKFKLK